jgi:hypothetical protein
MMFGKTNTIQVPLDSLLYQFLRLKKVISGVFTVAV